MGLKQLVRCADAWEYLKDSLQTGHANSVSSSTRMIILEAFSGLQGCLHVGQSFFVLSQVIKLLHSCGRNAT